jgi:surface antigen
VTQDPGLSRAAELAAAVDQAMSRIPRAWLQTPQDRTHATLRHIAYRQPYGAKCTISTCLLRPRKGTGAGMASLRFSLLRSIRALLVIFVVLLTGTLLASEAAATGTWLCTGYSGCATAGYSDAGYSAASSTSYWGMDPGHNCTNYAAYRLIKNRVDASYLRGQGNAYQWGGVAQGHGVAVDGTPRAGDIAWWDTNSGGSGQDGHVAYVEHVGNGYIIVSEDNYGGDFHWVKLTPGGYYPTGFIHFGGATSGGGSSSATSRLIAPSAVLDPGTGRNIFFVSSNNTIHQWSVVGSSWGEYQLGNTAVAPGTSPSTVEDTSTGRNIFFVGTNGQIQQYSVVGGAWGEYQLGGSGGEAAASNTSPSAMVDPSTGRNVFYVGADNNIWQWAVNGTWLNTRLGTIKAATGTSPSAIEDPSTGRNIFFVGSNGQIQQYSVVGGAWGAYQLGGARGGEPAASGTSVSAVEDPTTGRNVFYVGADGYIWQWAVSGSTWLNTRLGTTAVATGTSPSAVVDSATGRNIFFVGTNGQIHQYSVVGGAWGEYQLGGTGGKAAASGTSPAAIVDPSTGRNVFYIGSDGNIWQWAINGTWLNTLL